MADIAKDAKIAPDAPALAGVSRLSSYLWRHCWKRAEGTVTGDAEDLHDMRVALRRQRSLLENFEGEKSQPVLSRSLRLELRGWRQELGRLGDALGTVRDHDVLDEYLQTYATNRLKVELGKSTVTLPGLVAFGRYLQDERAAAIAPMVKRINKARRPGDMQEQFARWALGLPAAFGPQTTLREVALQLLPVREAEILAQQNALEEGDNDIAHHELRKSLRRLRYTYETLGPCFGAEESEIKKRIESLVALQDLLGEMQDRAVLHAKALEAFAIKSEKEEADKLPADIAAFLRYGQTRRRQLLGKALTAWRKMREAESNLFVV